MREKLELLIKMWQMQIEMNLETSPEGDEFAQGVKCAYELAIEDLEEVIKGIK